MPSPVRRPLSATTLGRRETLMDISALTVAVQGALDRLRSTPARVNSSTDIPPEIQDAILDHELSKEVLKVLERQEEFANGRPLMVNSLSGRMGFQSQFVAPLLMREARHRKSADAAVRWLEKVLGTKSAAGIAVYTLWGLNPAKHVELLDDVDLRPFDSLPASRQKEGLTAPRWPSASLATPVYAWQPPTAALVARLEIVPYLVDINAEPDSAQKGRPDYRALFEDIRLCLAIIGPAAIIPGPSWFQYLDPDLEAAVIGAASGLSHQEIVPFHVPESKALDASEASELVKAYAGLAPSLKNRARTAMERLHQALVRRSPADQALEIAIALETLLVNSSGEHTFKIALRAALLTSEDVEERSHNRAMIEAVYGMRSALMHSGQAPTECKVHNHGRRPAAEVAADAARITALIIRRVLTRGELPDWNSLELSNGM